MKGPSERLKYDLQRVWRCPACGHQARTFGDVTARLCRCQNALPITTRRYMQLVEDGVRRHARPAVSHSDTPPGGTVNVAPPPEDLGLEAGPLGTAERDTGRDEASAPPV
jgi:hypothetical protein